MFGPGRHFPPAELRERERGERLDPEYQLSAKPPSPAQRSGSPPPSQSRSAVLQKEGPRGRGSPEVPMGLGLVRKATQGFQLVSS